MKKTILIMIALFITCAAPGAQDTSRVRTIPKEKLSSFYLQWFKNPYEYMFDETCKEKITVSGRKFGVFKAGMNGILYYGGLVSCMRSFGNHKNLSRRGDAEVIEQFSGIPVYRCTDDTYGFKYVNPEIIRWGKENLIPDAHSRIGSHTFLVVYQKVFQRFFRLMVESYLYLADRGSFEQEKSDYKENLKKEDFDAIDYLNLRFEGILREYSAYSDWESFNAPMAAGFWIRRGIDGTDFQLWAALELLMQQYDGTWYASLRKKYPHAGRLLGAGKAVPTGKESPSAGKGWSNLYVGAGDEQAHCIRKTRDGGYVIAGCTSSSGRGKKDILIIKLGSKGNILWQKTYGGPEDDEAYGLALTGDKGYMVAGSTGSYGSGKKDIWVVKLDSKGTILWQKTYGGPKDEEAHAIAPAGENRYVVTGYTKSCGMGDSDIVVMMLTTDGEVIWQKTHGGTGPDEARDVLCSDRKWLLLTGSTQWREQDKPRAWAMKLDLSGTIIWQKIYGSNEGNHIALSGEGGCFIAGNGELKADSLENLGWVAKLDGNGTCLWKKIYDARGIRYRCIDSIIPAGSGSFLAAGRTYVSRRLPSHMWLLRAGSGGEVIMSRRMGRSGESRALCCDRAADGGFVVAGTDRRAREDGEAYHEVPSDIWVTKTDAEGAITFNASSEVLCAPSAVHIKKPVRKEDIDELGAPWVRKEKKYLPPQQKAATLKGADSRGEGKDSRIEMKRLAP